MSYSFSRAQYATQPLMAVVRQRSTPLKKLLKSIINGKMPSRRCTALKSDSPARVQDLKTEFCLGAMAEKTVSF